MKNKNYDTEMEKEWRRGAETCNHKSLLTSNLFASLWTALKQSASEKGE